MTAHVIVQGLRIVFPNFANVVDENSFKFCYVDDLKDDGIHPVTAKVLLKMPGYNIKLNVAKGRVKTFGRGDGIVTAFDDEHSLSCITVVKNSLYDCCEGSPCSILSEKSKSEWKNILRNRRRYIRGEEVDYKFVKIVPEQFPDTIRTRLQTLACLGAENAQEALNLWSTAITKPEMDVVLANIRQFFETVENEEYLVKISEDYKPSLPSSSPLLRLREHAKYSVCKHLGQYGAEKKAQVIRAKNYAAYLSGKVGPLTLVHTLTNITPTLRRQLKVVPPNRENRDLPKKWHNYIEDPCVLENHTVLVLSKIRKYLDSFQPSSGTTTRFNFMKMEEVADAVRNEISLEANNRDPSSIDPLDVVDENLEMKPVVKSHETEDDARNVSLNSLYNFQSFLPLLFRI